LFLILAMLGGTFMVIQFVLALVGFGSDLEITDDLPEGSEQPYFGADAELGDNAVGHGNFSTWLFGVISIKTLTAAAAFFGLAGCAASAAQMSPPAQLVLATLAGVGAMYGVHWLMRTIMRFSEDGTVRIERSIGKQGTVYLTIPANRAGAGKVHFKLQNRLLEYAAVTGFDEPLRSGSKIKIVNVVNGSTLEVEPASV
jgi:membrane protein implicated in regulation of membrane protease activity